MGTRVLTSASGRSAIGSSRWRAIKSSASKNLREKMLVSCALLKTKSLWSLWISVVLQNRREVLAKTHQAITPLATQQSGRTRSYMRGAEQVLRNGFLSTRPRSWDIYGNGEHGTGNTPVFMPPSPLSHARIIEWIRIIIEKVRMHV